MGNSIQCSLCPNASKGYNGRVADTLLIQHKVRPRVMDCYREGLLYTAFQPIVDLRTWETFAFEALVRSNAEDFPTPYHLIKEAVRTGAMGELGRELRKMAVEGCPGYNLFLNIHPTEFDEKWLVRPDDAMLVHDQYIYMEITESVPIDHYQFCHSVLHEIRSKGIRLAVDDLGAGYSNLKYIVDLAPEIVKLDRQLIAGMTEGSRLHKLVSSIITLCDAQGAKVVAEGIETIDELRAVVTAGAHYGQGYFIARPSPTLPENDWSEIRYQL